MTLSLLQMINSGHNVLGLCGFREGSTEEGGGTQASEASLGPQVLALPLLSHLGRLTFLSFSFPINKKGKTILAS